MLILLVFIMVLFKMSMQSKSKVKLPFHIFTAILLINLLLANFTPILPVQVRKTYIFENITQQNYYFGVRFNSATLNAQTLPTINPELKVFLRSKITRTVTFTIENVQPYELAYDDGTAEFGFVATVGCVAAVKFSVNSQVQILKLKYFIWGEILPFRVHILDSNFNSIFSRDVKPSSADPHWFEVDISDANVMVNGDFFVGLEWITLYDKWPRPWLGVDNTPPCYGRSYLGTLSSPPASPKEGENYLIRVVVQKAPEPPYPTIFEPIIIVVVIIGVIAVVSYYVAFHDLE